MDKSRQGEPLDLEKRGNKRNLYIESYGCQMNFSDSEIIASILSENGFDTTKDIEIADLVLLNTCSIREKAEETVHNKLANLEYLKKKNPNILIGVVGCISIQEFGYQGDERWRRKALNAVNHAIGACS